MPAHPAPVGDCLGLSELRCREEARTLAQSERLFVDLAAPAASWLRGCAAARLRVKASLKSIAVGYVLWRMLDQIHCLSGRVTSWSTELLHRTARDQSLRERETGAGRVLAGEVGQCGAGHFGRCGSLTGFRERLSAV